MVPRSGAPEATQVVATIAGRLARRTPVEPRASRPTFPASGAGRTWLIRRTLEELGIHCEDSSELQDVAGCLMASQRGVEIVTSTRLTSDEQAQVYTQLLAQALLEPAHHPFFVRFEYFAGRDPGHRSPREIRTRRVAAAVARVILDGRLEGAPRLLFRGPPTAPPGSLPGLAATLLLRALHRTSVTLYWRSDQYQRVRAWPLTSQVISKVEEFLGQRPAEAS